MKSLPITSENFKYIEKSYREWLGICGYAETTVYGLPNQLREFFHWLETKNINHIKDIKTDHIKNYFHYTKQRTNTRFGGGLEPSYINKHRQMLMLFMDYLRQTGRYMIPYVKLNALKDRKEKLNTLTIEEVKQIFEATHVPDGSPWDQEVASRDRAILSLVYGCGLRRNEAKHLNMEDVNLDKGVVHVKKGKGNKERLVPISKSNIKYLEDYMYNARPGLLNSNEGPKRKPRERTYIPAFFVSMRCRRMDDQTINLRLRILVHKTNNPVIQEKNPSLHTLRHSIATHLLQNGMKLEAIAKFLGHDSLESTQIYTHLVEAEAAHAC